MCGQPMTPAGTGRKRLTCSNRCRQARYRLRHGQHRRRRKEWRPPERELMGERRTRPEDWKLIWRLSPVSAVYECLGCGQPYLVETVRRRGSRFCSNACEQRLRQRWKRLNAAIDRAQAEGKLDWRIVERAVEGRLSPQCAHCGTPFLPRYFPGRPRVYCSERCRKAAYEDRYARKHHRRRIHRYRQCPACGERMDRQDPTGALRRRYCSKACGLVGASRAYRRRKRRAREKAERQRRWLGMRAVQRELKQRSRRQRAASRRRSDTPRRKRITLGIL